MTQAASDTRTSAPVPPRHTDTHAASRPSSPTPQNRRSCGGIDRKTSEVGDGYAWYDVAEWVPERDHYFWIGPGRFDKKGGATSAIKAVRIDKLELIRVD